MAIALVYSVLYYYILLVMSELLFEGYGVPALCYGVDGLFSLYYDQGMTIHVHVLPLHVHVHVLSLPIHVHVLIRVVVIVGGNVTDGLVLNSGYQTTHIIPVINGRIVPGHSKR